MRRIGLEKPIPAMAAAGEPENPAIPVGTLSAKSAQTSIRVFSLPRLERVARRGSICFI